MQLTQEYFDNGMTKILEKLEGIESIMATKAGIADVRMDMEAQTIELKQYTTEAFEVQQLWMEERFDELIIKYDVRQRVEKLEKDFQKFKFSHSA